MLIPIRGDEMNNRIKSVNHLDKPENQKSEDAITQVNVVREILVFFVELFLITFI